MKEEIGSREAEKKTKALNFISSEFSLIDLEKVCMRTERRAGV